MKYDFGKIIVIEILHMTSKLQKSGAFAVGVATGSCTAELQNSRFDVIKFERIRKNKGNG